MARIYVASSWRNERQGMVVNILRNNDHEVYDFKNPPNRSGFKWSDVGLHASPELKAKDYIHVLTTHPVAAAGYMSDFRAMEWADTCLLLLPCGRSAHLEAGWFAGRGKRLIILTRDGEEPELMALMANHIFYDLNQVLNALK
jgi:hypothetical protein